ncbi:hypothetical protein H012_gp429 [Acanthamoeba polyphaga moumouvirus]|uniref:Uncharacterized protein n=1 Tax=Acanthamoeba polyphaga moumouvirus TaxID=1269028 RepID=L7RG71_9VIRU|nr:hypothetical protein H012_gp429 [Acanthamoeba polyphaga moumouvirus]AGC02030.1 hypothetical protein Moumou_00496 [Acanthamoeba polyphaga moumouvirus]
MTFNNSAIIIVIVVAFAFYLIYSQNNQPKYIQPSPQISNFKPNIETACSSCSRNQDSFRSQDNYKNDNYRNQEPSKEYENRPAYVQPKQIPQTTNVYIEHETDPYSDPIKNKICTACKIH